TEEKSAGKDETSDKNGPSPAKQKADDDPITGTWTFTLEGFPLPEPQEGVMFLKLDNGRITGTSKASIEDEEMETGLTGTLEGDQVVLEIEEETPAGRPRVEARLDAPDHMKGEMRLGDYFQIDFEARRTEKSAPVFKVSLKKKKSKDGRPEPPKVQAALEPYRKLFSREAVALVEVETAAEIDRVISVFSEEYKVPLALLTASDAERAIDRIRDAQSAVVISARVLDRRDGVDYLLSDALARNGIPLAFQSDVEDGAEMLPLNAAYAVHKGLDPGEALKALTLYPARIFRIDHRVGSLEPGKDADLVVFSGEPLELTSSVLHVFINGDEVKP
ncbi:MAG: amidohydrolase family protein, partial [Planctomycetes bacterium]|nr:amidohydrolase family protein [Planctomycetota bacterium]